MEGLNRRLIGAGATPTKVAATHNHFQWNDAVAASTAFSQRRHAIQSHPLTRWLFVGRSISRGSLVGRVSYASAESVQAGSLDNRKIQCFRIQIIGCITVVLSVFRMLNQDSLIRALLRKWLVDVYG